MMSTRFRRVRCLTIAKQSSAEQRQFAWCDAGQHTAPQGAGWALVEATTILNNEAKPAWDTGLAHHPAP